MAPEPDDSLTADRVEFGQSAGIVLHTVEGVPAAGRAFRFAIWLKQGENAGDGLVDLMVMDAKKEVHVHREQVQPTEQWERHVMEVAFPASDSDSPVTVRVGNDYARPAPLDVLLWGPELLEIEAPGEEGS